MINTPTTANSIVGFDIDNYVKGDIADNNPPTQTAPLNSAETAPLTSPQTALLKKTAAKIPENVTPSKENKLQKSPKRDVVEIKTPVSKEEKAWGKFGVVFLTTLTAIISIPFIKKKTFKK